MTDHYKISLQILYQLLSNSGNNHWSNWLSEDLHLWETKKDTKHHLGAYGGMGSLNDVFVGKNNKTGAWENHLFEVIKNLAFNLASNKINTAPTDPNFYKYGNKELTGWICWNCNYQRIEDIEIEDYLARKLTLTIISELIKSNKLSELLPVNNWIKNSELEEERNQLKSRLKLSNIDIYANGLWLNTCSKCSSNNVSVFRWVVNEETNEIIESNTNLKKKKSQHTTMAIDNAGFWGKIKSWF